MLASASASMTALCGLKLLLDGQCAGRPDGTLAI